jgi:hypothetical protein
MSVTELQPYHLGLYAREWIDGPPGSLPSTTDSDSPTIYISDLDRSEMTAEQARQHAVVMRQAADHLLKTADMLDQIEGVSA